MGKANIHIKLIKTVKPLTFNRSYGIIFILKDSNSNFLIVRNWFKTDLKLSCNYKTDTAMVEKISDCHSEAFN